MSIKQRIKDSLTVYHSDGKRYIWFCPVEVQWFNRHGLQVGGPYDEHTDLELAKELITEYLTECLRYFLVPK